jgi:hypothetical protein
VLKFTEYFGLKLLHQVPYFDAILPNAVATKIVKNYVLEKLLRFGAKNVGEIDPQFANEALAMVAVSSLS